MTITGPGVRIPEGASATLGMLRVDERSGVRESRVGSPGKGGAGAIGLLAAGGVGLVGGLALRAAGFGRIGTGLAAISGVLLGASLLTACGPGPGRQTRTDVPGDEGAPGDDVDIVADSWRDLPTNGSDTTNPAPASYVPESGTRDARDGVVQVAHSTGMGSGWVVEPGKVVTNYHVAQGYEQLEVIDHEGVSHDGTVQRLDRTHDLALVYVPTLRATPLPMDDVVEDIEFGETTGYPDGVFRNDAATAAGLIDIVDDGRTREALLLLGESEQGVSGGAVINGAGEVIGTSFAVGELDGDGDPTEFVLAIPNEQVQAFLDG